MTIMFLNKKTAEKDFIKDLVSRSTVSDRSASILPVQVKYVSDINSETKNENRRLNSDFQHLTKTKDEKRK